MLLTALQLPAQIAIDVKTPWDEKVRLRTLKSGVSAAIDAAAWGRTTEFGEDYVVMLRDLERRRCGGDSIWMLVTVDLRTPSFLGRGDEIATKRIELRYCGKALDSVAAEMSDGGVMADGAQGKGGGNLLDQKAIVDRLLKLGVDLLPISSPIVKTLLTAALTTIDIDPEPTEIAEGVLLGSRVVMEVDQMLPR